MSITLFVSAIAGDIAVEWTCDQPALVTRLKQLIQAGFRFVPAEQIGRVAGELAAEGVRVRDRDIADLIKARLVRVIDIQGGWEAKSADPLTAEEAAESDTIAIRAAPTRSSRRSDG